MNAMIFAAGLGTRLMPLTKDQPKALVNFKGRPLLWHAIQHVVDAGATLVVVNVHHYADLIISYINSIKWAVPVIISDERDLLLDTGGGIVRASHLFIQEQPVIVYNADIVTDCDVKPMIDAHIRQNNEATLMVNHRQSTRYLIFDSKMQLCGWKNVSTSELIMAKEGTSLTDLAFCGIHVLAYDFIAKLGAEKVFSIINGYLNCASCSNIFGWKMPENASWFDVGTIEKLKEAENYF